MSVHGRRTGHSPLYEPTKVEGGMHEELFCPKVSYKTPGHQRARTRTNTAKSVINEETVRITHFLPCQRCP